MVFGTSHHYIHPADFDVDTVLADVLAEFWWMALRNCVLIDKHRPDLVIGLAHGGIAPTRATADLWQRLSPTKSPAVLYTNLGGEKIVRYRAACAGLGLQAFYGFQSSYEEILHFLEWLPLQTDWLGEFRTQIMEVMQDRIPETILVIDEMMAEGRTMLLSLGLLHILLPHTKALFVDGPHFNWREAFAWCWLKKTEPEAFQVLLDRVNQDRRSRKLPICPTYAGGRHRGRQHQLLCRAISG